MRNLSRQNIKIAKSYKSSIPIVFTACLYFFKCSTAPQLLKQYITKSQWAFERKKLLNLHHSPLLEKPNPMLFLCSWQTEYRRELQLGRHLVTHAHTVHCTTMQFTCILGEKEIAFYRGHRDRLSGRWGTTVFSPHTFTCIKSIFSLCCCTKQTWSIKVTARLQALGGVKVWNCCSF